jgi:hypothetical protein
MTFGVFFGVGAMRCIAQTYIVHVRRPFTPQKGDALHRPYTRSLSPDIQIVLMKTGRINQ